MIEAVESMPWEGEYPAAATAVMLRYGEDTLRHTLRYYAVRNVRGELIMGVGVALWSFARPPELWVILAKPYFVNLRQSLRDTRDAMPVPLADFPGLVCDVERNSRVELHFVEHMGWVPTGRRSLRPNGDDFIQFGVL